jgi:hypothetical protein
VIPFPSVRRGLAALVALAAASAAPAAPPHEHGVARLGVAVAANAVQIDLDTPLENLLGFERAPRTDAERDKVAALVARLRAGEDLFRIDAQAGCTLSRVTLIAPVLELGGPLPATAGAHADLEGSYEFSCKNGAAAGFLEVGLFDGFAGLRRIDMQVATPRGQLKATLRRPSQRVRLAR